MPEMKKDELVEWVIVYVIIFTVLSGLYLLDVHLRMWLSPSVVSSVKNVSFTEALFSRLFDVWLYFNAPVVPFVLYAVIAFLVVLAAYKRSRFF